jgi:hypothetical protein
MSRGYGPERAELDRVARLLMNEWERVEGKPVNPSYIATFVDMARVVIADRKRHQPTTRRCPNCDGRGWIDDGHQGWFSTPNVKCVSCDGKGFVS